MGMELGERRRDHRVIQDAGPAGHRRAEVTAARVAWRDLDRGRVGETLELARVPGGPDQQALTIRSRDQQTGVPTGSPVRRNVTKSMKRAAAMPSTVSATAVRLGGVSVVAVMAGSLRISTGHSVVRNVADIPHDIMSCQV